MADAQVTQLRKMRDEITNKLDVHPNDPKLQGLLEYYNDKIRSLLQAQTVALSAKEKFDQSLDKYVKQRPASHVKIFSSWMGHHILICQDSVYPAEIMKTDTSIYCPYPWAAKTEFWVSPALAKTLISAYPDRFSYVYSV
jgi:DNA-binding transcriptional regulator YbjK